MPLWNISSTGTILECLPKVSNFDNMSGVWNTIFARWPTPLAHLTSQLHALFRKWPLSLGLS